MRLTGGGSGRVGSVWRVWRMWRVWRVWRDKKPHKNKKKGGILNQHCDVRYFTNNKI